MKFRPTHGGGPIGPQLRHQNRLFSANVVIFRRTHKSSRRGKEGGGDPVRERVKSVRSHEVPLPSTLPFYITWEGPTFSEKDFFR